MKKVAILGLLVAITPFLGFPGSWENIIFVILGLAILAQSLYSSKGINLPVNKEKQKLQNNVYVENGNSPIVEK